MIRFPEIMFIVITFGIYVGFGVIGAWIYDQFVRPRLYEE